MAMRCLLVAACAAAGAHATDPESAFKEFMERFAKSYITPAEQLARYEVFKVKLALVEAENALDRSYKLEINSFADMTDEEFRAHHLGLLDTPEGQKFKHLGTHRYSGAELPASVDWVAQGKVTPVKNQAACGSCWAFSTTGSLEGAWAIKTGNLVSLSEQQLVDCASSAPWQNHGCHGGLMDFGFDFIEKNGLCTEESYPYKAADDKCASSNCSVGVPAGRLTGYKDVTPSDINALMEAVAQQPVSVAIEADQSVFQLYKGGVLTSDKCGVQLDHGVLIVGYGTDNGIEYWKVKNSWGPSWGESGYLRIGRNETAAGECGIKLKASYPVVSAGSELII